MSLSLQQLITINSNTCSRGHGLAASSLAKYSHVLWHWFSQTVREHDVPSLIPFQGRSLFWKVEFNSPFGFSMGLGHSALAAKPSCDDMGFHYSLIAGDSHTASRCCCRQTVPNQWRAPENILEKYKLPENVPKLSLGSILVCDC